MAINATTAGYTNTGHDIHMSIVDSNGGTVNIENVMQFDSRQETQDITRVRLDNRVLVADLPRNWSGTVLFDRASGNADVAIATLEDHWFSGQDYELGTMIINVVSGKGENTTITFHDLTLRFDDAGTWRGDDATSCRLAFRATRREVTGAPYTVSAALNQN